MFPEHIRALIYILIITAPVLFVAQMVTKPFVEPKDFAVWRNAWIATTIAVFTTGDLWLLIGCLVLIASYVYTSKIEHKYLFIALMFAIPSVEFTLSVFGVINKLLDMNGARLLSIFFLVPTALLMINRVFYNNPNREYLNLVFFRKENSDSKLLRYVDVLVVLYVFILIFLSLRLNDINHTLRMCFIYTLDILLPYFIFSRTIGTYREARKTLAAFVVGVLPIAVIGIFETARNWRLYNAVIDQWEITLLTPYLYRDGLLRAAASSVEAIAFAFTCMVAIGCLIALRRPPAPYVPVHGRPWNNLFVLAAFAILTLGLLASLSRGPWIGLVLMLLIFTLSGRRLVSNSAKTAVAAVVLLGALSATPFAERLYRVLPFVGSIQEDTEEYRVLLLQNSIKLIKRNPYFGAPDYLDTPEMAALIQGQGIIDVVNSYAAIALEFGLVTLAVFVAVFLVIGLRLAVLCYRENEDDSVLVRAVAATLAAMLVTIATVSSISTIPYIYWTFAGLSVAIIRIHAAARSKARDPLLKLNVLGAAR